MEVMYTILVFSVAIIISNVLYHFFPFLSLPLIQIALGFIIGLLPMDIMFHFEPEFFLLVFIAPLLFNDGKNSDLKSLWKLRKEIFFLAIILVFVTVVILGYTIEGLIPTLPLAASFALAAALAPTDAVTVASLSQRAQFSKKSMHLLEGEALINDASGITAFQIAVLALFTGTFSFFHAAETFIFIAVGGILVGMIMSFIKNKASDAMRRFGMKDIILHIFLEILLPFGAYTIAEILGVSGILAVVVAGMLQSSRRKRTDIYEAKLNLVTNNIWEAIIFFLKSMVFLLLGSQLPHITQVLWDTGNITTHISLILIILAITVMLFLLRFIFLLAMKLIQERRKRKKRKRKKKVQVNFKELGVLTLSGVKGSVTLATMLSLPFYLGENTLFVTRDLLILISCGVILFSLIIAIIFLPLLGSKNEESVKKDNLAILEAVVSALRKKLGTGNIQEVMPVILEYQKRISDLKRDTKSARDDGKERLKIRKLIFKWERENLQHLLDEGKICEDSRYQYEGMLTVMEAFSLKKVLAEVKVYARIIFRSIKRVFHKSQRMDEKKRQQIIDELLFIHVDDEAYIIEKLKEMETEENAPLIEPIILLHKNMLKQLRENPKDLSFIPGGKSQETEVRMEGYQIERDMIQQFYEKGRISLEAANDMRQDVNLLETYSMSNNNDRIFDLIFQRIRRKRMNTKNERKA